MPRTTRKTRRWALGGGPVVAILAAFVGLSMPRERLLLEMAHPVCRIDTSLDKQNNPNEQVYWITSSRLLIITTEHKVSNQNDWSCHAELFDSGTHARTRLTGLTNLLKGPGFTFREHPYGFQFTPTGTRLFWSVFREHRQGDVWISECRAAAATLEGAELREWRMEDSLPSFWADEQHFVQERSERGQHEYLIIRDTRDSHADRYLPASGVQAGSILARYDQDHPFITRVDGSQEGCLHIASLWFDAKSRQIANRMDTVPLPKNTKFIWGAENTHQSRTPLLLQRSEMPLVWTWIHRVIPVITVQPAVTEGLWIGGVGTEQMQEIGHVPVRVDNDNNIVGDQIDQVEWLPDGKQVSFLYRGTLYIAQTTVSK